LVAVAAANTWGLTLVIVLLGYSLVEIPKLLWRNGNQILVLKRYQYEALIRKEELETARKELDTVLKVCK
jgi:hypothetical protein